MLLLQSGCALFSGSQYREPEISLEQVEVEKASLWEQRLALTIRVDNPNSVSLPINKLIYSVDLDGVLLASGQSNSSFTVPANGHRRVTLPVRTNLWRHIKRIVKMLEKPDNPVPYRLRGEVKTGMLFGQTLTVDRSGHLLPNQFIPD
ncbi:LEA type 2 family protein [Atopomonas sediminilitoris]|uniref:LEA type 2 family protein n=1 Tax=Atopomonas sediminilitoris TaxID=2919919 RepID=UPI001F4ECB72|nr:LEA type 2 family protein [Atopomonas sediminilitoris]MCJ8170120.1 LEA type 2 family protein [Atopomonas sediminilitoris]